MREKQLFDDDWRIHHGEEQIPFPTTKTPVYCQAKTERKQWGFAAESYHENDSRCPDKWEKVTLPHDFIIHQTPNENNNHTLGYFSYGAAWYKKRFVADKGWEGKRVTLYFEGVATECEVYVNSCLMARNMCGYTPFEVDMTDVLRYGAQNTVCVHVNSDVHEGWWYSGGGIFRHVWLQITAPVAVDLYGVYINPRQEKDGVWTVFAETTVRNDGDAPANAVVQTVLYAKDGEIVADTEANIALWPRDKAVAASTASVANPALWDIDAPHLYKAVTTVLVDGKQTDEVETTFGFRTAVFDKDQGFLLNGRRVPIHGVCCHEDYGITGKAMPDTVKEYRLRLLKEMGANGYRTAHYPHSEQTMDYLDQLGFLVLDETRWFTSTPQGLMELECLVKRDRNHPSVVLWSIGNEEPLHTQPQGKRIARSMKAAIKKLDCTRPVTTAVSNTPLCAPVFDEMDVIGLNYNVDCVETLRKQYPDKPFLFTECCAAATTRGWYHAAQPERGYIPAYDHKNFSGACREDMHKLFLKYRFLAGGYQWAGIEHRGETDWPRVCSQSGALDLFLQKKDAFYQNQSHWTDAPMVHILPHWNHAGREGEPIVVWVYTNCEQISLSLNGTQIAEKPVKNRCHVEFCVPYTPGTLVAEGKIGGTTAAVGSVVTTGRAAALCLRLENGPVRANGRDVAVATCFCVDAHGRPVPDASPTVSFYCNGLGTVVGTGSAVTDHTPPHVPDRTMYAGLISVAVRAGTQTGTCRLFASADGFDTASLDILLVKDNG